MVIFINDIRVTLYKPTDEPAAGSFSHVVDAATVVPGVAQLVHHVWIKNADEKTVGILLELLNSKVPLHLVSLQVSVTDYESIKAFLKSRFKVIKAAGGLVRKKDKLLMIYRLKKWDLPKGKKEKGEKYKETAVREIEEECGVRVKIGKKICITWHTYTMNKNAMLKKTKWYEMELIDDSRMAPSIEEDIEQVRWMNAKEAYHALHNSYKSIAYVFESYYEQTGEKKISG
jgi:ADP-ribose pyrophosphatase YjhB (NUDIX family)